MQIDTLTAQTALATSLDTCLATLSRDVDGPVQALYADLAAQRIAPDAPLVFIYRDLDGDPQRRFTLEVAQPLEEADLATYDGALRAVTLTPLRCVQREHLGDLEDMGSRTYAPLFADIAAAGLTPGAQCREVYSVYNGPHSADNRTLVQVEVQAAGG
ncbi:MAG: hypothetical protein AAGA11_07680 [Pseudomonadota bacterium]